MVDQSQSAERLRLDRIKRLIRVLLVVVTVALFAAIWLVGFRGDDSPAPIVPDTASQFSLDLRVVASTDHDIVYAVEQRARPSYRIFSFDPDDGAVETIFTVPEDAIIYGIALSSDRATLAVSYSPDFSLEGSGLWTLDVDSGDFEQIIDVVSNRYFVDPVWSDDDAIVATRVDRSTEDESLDIVEIALDDASITLQVANGVSPAVDGDHLYFLEVGDDKARRSIGHVTAVGPNLTIEVQNGEFDLDHLLARDNTTYVAVLENTDTGLTIGDPADAHGNHDVPSTWWQSTGIDGGEPIASSLEPIIVYDAAATSQRAIVYATLEGLSIGQATSDGVRIDLIKSRAIRFVAA